jgi:hypothetical protein
MQYIPYCIDDPNKTLSLYGSGIIDDLDKYRNVSKIYVKVKKCRNSTENYFQCLPNEEIDKFLEGK